MESSWSVLFRQVCRTSTAFCVLIKEIVLSIMRVRIFSINAFLGLLDGSGSLPKKNSSNPHEEIRSERWLEDTANRIQIGWSWRIWTDFWNSESIALKFRCLKWYKNNYVSLNWLNNYIILFLQLVVNRQWWYFKISSYLKDLKQRRRQKPTGKLQKRLRMLLRQVKSRQLQIKHHIQQIRRICYLMHLFWLEVSVLLEQFPIDSDS